MPVEGFAASLTIFTLFSYPQKAKKIPALSVYICFPIFIIAKKRYAKPLNKHHELCYGVRLASIDPNEHLTGVTCKFCATFGREQRTVSARIAKKWRVSVCPSFTSFRPEYFVRHHRDHHAVKWTWYNLMED